MRTPYSDDGTWEFDPVSGGYVQTGVPAMLSTDTNGNTVLVGEGGVGVLKNNQTTGTLERWDAASGAYVGVGGKPYSRSNIELIGVGNSGAGSTTAAVGNTWQHIVSARSRPLAVQISYVNRTSTAYTVDKTSITPSDSLVVGGDPSGGATPVNVLFAGGAPAVAMAGSATAPTEVLSDWTYIAPLDRVDGGSFNLFHIRSYLANAGATNIPYLSIAPYAGFPGNTISGRVWTAGNMAGDKIATPTGFSNNGGLALFMNIKFKEVAQGIRVVSIGDSIIAGIAPSSLAGAFASITDQAIALINPTTISNGVIFSHHNAGYTGQTVPQYLARLTQILANSVPDVVVLPCFSPNSLPSTQAALDTNNGLLLDAIYKVKAAGAVPVLWTGIPFNAATAAQDALRIANNTMWKNAAIDGGFIVADFDAVMAGGTVGGVVQLNSYLSVDGTHPNAAGQAACAAVLADKLRVFLNY